MGIMRWNVYNRLKTIYPNDAFYIANNLGAIRSKEVYYRVFKRKHNRQIHKCNFIKGGKKKSNQAPYIVKEFRLFDKVKYNNQECLACFKNQCFFLTS